MRPESPYRFLAPPGRCEYLLSGSSEWVASGAGEKFSVPGNSSFQIRVSGEPYSYICHFG